MKAKDKDAMKFLGTMRLLMRYMGPPRTKLGSELNMTPVHHRTLFYINEHDNCKMTDIANAFVLSPAAVTRTVNNLIEVGLVERFRDEADRRVVRVRLTDKGRETMLRGLEEISAMLSEVFGRMEAEDLTALIRGMDALRNALRECVGSDR